MPINLLNRNMAIFKVIGLIIALTFSYITFCSASSISDRKDNFDERGSYYGGDVIFPIGMDNGVVGDFLRWPNATLIYALDKNFTEQELGIVADAMAEIENKTCIRFKARENETGYVFIARGVPDSGCYSFLGRLGAVQQLNLEAPGCITKGIAMHEMLHAIGFYHEQSREDRDDFVTINWDNIEPGTEFNFIKATITLTYNVTYDYGSIMHYSKYSFANNVSVPTIIPIDPDAEIGQRQRLSDKDIYKVNAMYCPESNQLLPSESITKTNTNTLQ